VMHPVALRARGGEADLPATLSAYHVRRSREAVWGLPRRPLGTLDARKDEASKRAGPHRGLPTPHHGPVLVPPGCRPSSMQLATRALTYRRHRHHAGSPSTPKISAPAAPSRLLDRVRHAIRLRRMSGRTEDSYVAWIRRFRWESERTSSSATADVEAVVQR